MQPGKLQMAAHLISTPVVTFTCARLLVVFPTHTICLHGFDERCLYWLEVLCTLLRSIAVAPSVVGDLGTTAAGARPTPFYGNCRSWFVG